jgi:DNA-binding cell septation regulator SpoVG
MGNRQLVAGKIGMEITSVKIEPNPEPDAQLKAIAQVVLNGSLSLRGIRILRGRYGLFLAFPELGEDSLQRAFEPLSMRFRRELHDEVLSAYRKASPHPAILVA